MDKMTQDHKAYLETQEQAEYELWLQQAHEEAEPEYEQWLKLKSETETAPRETKRSA